MYQKFEDYFKIPVSKLDKDETESQVVCFLRKFQGKNFGDGLYRVFKKEEIDKWKEIIGDAYLDLKGYFTPFAYDWLGRCFAIDERPYSEHKNQILLFEIGTADVLEIPCDIISFHNDEIIQNTDACLAKEFFNQWQANNKMVLAHNECVGYKIPLFLSGADVIENLEVSDMEVYWHILASIKNQI